MPLLPVPGSLSLKRGVDGGTAPGRRQRKPPEQLCRRNRPDEWVVLLAAGCSPTARVAGGVSRRRRG